MKYASLEELMKELGPYMRTSFATEWVGGVPKASGLMILLEDGSLVFDAEVPAQSIFGLPMGDARAIPTFMRMDAGFVARRVGRKSVQAYQKNGRHEPKAMKKAGFFDALLVEIRQEGAKSLHETSSACYYFDILSDEFVRAICKDEPSHKK